MLNYLLEKGMTYKEFVKWCDARLKDNKWLPSEAMKNTERLAPSLLLQMC